MSPVFRDRRPQTHDPIRMVLDDDTVDRLKAAAVEYGMEVEELMVALLQSAALRIPELLGDPRDTRRFR
jgi:hypothetical protein